MDSRDYEKGMKDAISSSKNVESAIKGLQSPLDKARNAFDAITQPVETAKNNFAQLKDKVAAAAHPIQNIKNKIQESAAAMETQQNRLKVLAGSYGAAKDKVAALTAEFNKSVKETGATSAESKKLADELTKAEKEADEAKSAMDEYAASLGKTGDKSDEAETKTQKLANALKNGVVNGAKLAAKGAAVAAKGTAISIGAAATGIGAIVKQSVSAYGEFEQLKGGAEKIFAGMDMKMVAADANNAFKTLNMSASEYYESINQVGAAFVSSMGAEKAYETAKTGMTAIADFASGTGKSVEELNEKYAMITRSTASYQSIADQFSGILPQTNKDFLEQAQAAGLLSKSYTQLTQVPVAEYQEAVTQMLAKGVDQIGLTKNAYNESTKTLTGSLAMTKKAWENFVTGLSDKDADIGQLVDNLLSSGEAALKKITPLIEQALPSIATSIKQALPKLITKATGLIKTTMPSLIGAAVDLVVELGHALADNTDAIVDAVFAIIDVFVDSLSDPNGLMSLIDAAGTILFKLADGLIENLPNLIPAIIDIILQIVNKLTDPQSVNELVGAALSIIIALVDGIAAALPQIVQQAPLIIANLVIGLVGAFGQLLVAGGDIIVSLLGGIADSFGQLVANGGEIITQIGDGIKQKIDDAKEWGKNLIDGFVKGILEKWDALKSKVTGIIDGVKNIFTGKKGLDEASPSKWGKKVFGYLLEGGEEGLENETPSLVRQAGRTVSAVQDAFNDSMTYSPTVNGEYIAYTDPRIDKILSLLESYLPAMSNMQVTLDSGALVGNLTPDIDRQLGSRAYYARRGMTTV